MANFYSFIFYHLYFLSLAGQPACLENIYHLTSVSGSECERENVQSLTSQIVA